MQWDELERWHALDTPGISQRLDSDATNGLTRAEAERRLTIFGLNLVSQQRGPNALLRFLEQFNNPLIYVLLVAGAVTLLLPGHAVDAIVIFGVVLLNAMVGFLQESRARAAIEALRGMLSVSAHVVRDGQRAMLDADQLVPGDVVLLQSGDRVPADLRLLHVHELHVNESALTGESLPVTKRIEPLPADSMLADRGNMAFSGTLVSSGQGTGMVVNTGDRTELGHISYLIQSAETLDTPLTRRLKQFSLYLTWVILGIAALTIVLGLLRGAPWGATFLAAVALAVAAIPEGLPAAVTIILAIRVTRMAQRKAIIRNLPAVETLGSTMVICSDKTGTLTKNEMTVTMIVAGEAQFTVTGTGYAPTGEIHRDGSPANPVEYPALQECLQAGVLCNDADLFAQEERWLIEGDPTEAALLTVAAKAGMDAATMRTRLPRYDIIPFESERQYMATLNERHDGTRVAYVKGAVERILERCTQALRADGSIGPLDSAHVRTQADALAADGLRVLAFAMRSLPAEQYTLPVEVLNTDLIFVGLQGMIDPPRPEAIAAVEACRQAGVKVKMITGDHALTARAIAAQLGIGRGEVEAINGGELAQIPLHELPAVADRADVFARVAPEQKLRLVEALQSRGQVVAMTGDGVNDAPALKRADIGIAMGITGTEAAKDAADMVLADDNFATIEAAVEEGRGVYDNLRKFIIWTLPTNAGEGMLVLTAIALGLDIPVLPGHILWINMMTTILLGTALAFEPKEPGLMKRPARDPREPVITREMLIRLGYVSVLMVLGAFGLYEWELYLGYSETVARTVVANVIVIVETIYLFNSRSLRYPVTHLGIFSNPYTIIGPILMLFLQGLFVYLPGMNRLFSTAPVPAITWLEAFAIAGFVFTIVEIEKWVRRRKHNARTGIFRR